MSKSKAVTRKEMFVSGIPVHNLIERLDAEEINSSMWFFCYRYKDSLITITWDKEKKKYKYVRVGT
jgi:hypothetical protein